LELNQIFLRISEIESAEALNEITNKMTGISQRESTAIKRALSYEKMEISMARDCRSASSSADSDGIHLN